MSFRFGSLLLKGSLVHSKRILRISNTLYTLAQFLASSISAVRLIVASTWLSTAGDRAFLVVTTHVTSVPSQQTFK